MMCIAPLSERVRRALESLARIHLDVVSIDRAIFLWALRVRVCDPAVEMFILCLDTHSMLPQFHTSAQTLEQMYALPSTNSRCAATVLDSTSGPRRNT